MLRGLRKWHLKKDGELEKKGAIKERSQIKIGGSKREYPILRSGKKDNIPNRAQTKGKRGSVDSAQGRKKLPGVRQKGSTPKGLLNGPSNGEEGWGGKKVDEVREKHT